MHKQNDGRWQEIHVNRCNSYFRIFKNWFAIKTYATHILVCVSIYFVPYACVFPHFPTMSGGIHFHEVVNKLPEIFPCLVLTWQHWCDRVLVKVWSWNMADVKYYDKFFWLPYDQERNLITNMIKYVVTFYWKITLIIKHWHRHTNTDAHKHTHTFEAHAEMIRSDCMMYIAFWRNCTIY